MAANEEWDDVRSANSTLPARAVRSREASVSRSTEAAVGRLRSVLQNPQVVEPALQRDDQVAANDLAVEEVDPAEVPARLADADLRRRENAVTFSSMSSSARSRRTTNCCAPPLAEPPIVPPDIVECSQFRAVAALSLRQMQEIALPIDPRPGVNDGSYR
jgi:hypothetical protein